MAVPCGEDGRFLKAEGCQYQLSWPEKPMMSVCPWGGRAVLSSMGARGLI